MRLNRPHALSLEQHAELAELLPRLRADLLALHAILFSRNEVHLGALAAAATLRRGYERLHERLVRALQREHPGAAGPYGDGRVLR